VTTPQHEATLLAVASLDHAKILLNSDHRTVAGWTPDLLDRVTEGIRACRWFLATGFDPPGQFGTWLRTTLDEGGLGPLGDRDAACVAAWQAADCVENLKEQWRPEWSMTDDPR
jgi:hypothetical protein